MIYLRHEKNVQWHRAYIMVPPDPGRSKMGSGKRSKGYLRIYTRCWLVLRARGYASVSFPFNVKEGIIQEKMLGDTGCSGMTHSAPMASGDPSR